MSASQIKATGLRNIPGIVKPEWLNPDLSFNQEKLKSCETIDSGKYHLKVLGGLGQGATAKTHCVFDEEKNAFYAVKISRGHESGRGVVNAKREAETKAAAIEAIKPFAKEHAILAKAGKSSASGRFILPHVVDETLDSVHIIMDLESGKDLSHFTGAKSSFEAIDLLRNISAQVFNLHGKGIIHGDINPGNFMIEGEHIAVLDFGQSFFMNKQGNACEYVGEGNKAIVGVGYAAPELEIQRTNITRTRETDIFSLGKVLQKCVENTPLADHPEVMGLLNRMTAAKPEDRPKESEIKNVLQGIRQSFIPITHKTVGILNVSDYVKSDAEGKAQYLEALRSMNEVVLVRTDERAQAVSPLDLELLKRDLRENNIRTQTKTYKQGYPETLLVVVPTSADLSGVPKFLETQNKNKSGEVPIQNYFHVSTKPQPMKGIHSLAVTPLATTEKYQTDVNKTLSKEFVTDTDKAKIISMLQKEREALSKKYPSKTTSEGKIAADRIKKLDAAITSFDASISYQSLKLMLTNLQKEMRPTSGLRKLLGLESRGSVELGKIIAYADKCSSFPKPTVATKIEPAIAPEVALDSVHSTSRMRK